MHRECVRCASRIHDVRMTLRFGRRTESLHQSRTQFFFFFRDIYMKNSTVRCEKHLARRHSAIYNILTCPHTHTHHTHSHACTHRYNGLLITIGCHTRCWITKKKKKRRKKDTCAGRMKNVDSCNRLLSLINQTTYKGQSQVNLTYFLQQQTPKKILFFFLVTLPMI